MNQTGREYLSKIQHGSFITNVTKKDALDFYYEIKVMRIYNTLTNQHLNEFNHLMIFSTNAASTSGGTTSLILPLCFATFFAIELDINEYLLFVIINNVSTSSASLRFILAICISYSKSDTARSPRTIASAFTSKQKSI